MGDIFKLVGVFILTPIPDDHCKISFEFIVKKEDQDKVDGITINKQAQAICDLLNNWDDQKGSQKDFPIDSKTTDDDFTVCKKCNQQKQFENCSTQWSCGCVE